MRVSYLGNKKHSWCTEVHVARDIEALGHTVTFVQETPGGTDPRGLGRVERALLAGEPDLVLFTRTWGLPDEATAMWRRMEARGIITASLHLDLYRGLQRGDGVRSDPFWTTEHVFTPDGNEESQVWFESMGINHHWSPPAVVSDECYPGAYDPRFAVDVAFVGSRAYHAEWPWRPKLIDWLENMYGDLFRRFSGDEGHPVRGDDLNNLYATVGVAVGDSLHLPGNRRYTSDRLTETLGRGGVLLYPDLPVLAELGFVEFDHLRTYEVGDFDSIAGTIEELLAYPGQARAMAVRGQEFVRANHTYKHRLAKAFKTMGLG